MIKKLLLIPLMGIISFGAFASANTIGVCSSDSEIEYAYYVGQEKKNLSPCQRHNSCIIQLSPSSNNYTYPSFDSSDTVFEELGVYDDKIYINFHSDLSSDHFKYINSDSPFDINFFYSSSPITCNIGSSDNGDSSYVPSIPDSFTSGLTNLINNFGSTLVDWLPTIILVALGIYAIFALFRVVRNYAKSAFEG